MKKILFAVVMAMMSTAMFAQKGSTYVGGQVNYGLDSDYKNFGIGAKVQYEFIDNLRGEASFNYFFKKDYVTMWDVNVNLHYLFRLNDQFAVYPLAGVTLLGWNVDVLGESVSDSDLGYNLGGGIEYKLNENIKLNFEGKYQSVKDWDHPVISLGVAFAL